MGLKRDLLSAPDVILRALLVLIERAKRTQRATLLLLLIEDLKYGGTFQKSTPALSRG